MEASGVSDQAHLWTPPQEGSKLTLTFKPLTFSHTMVEPEQDADCAMMIVEHLDFKLRSSGSHRFQFTQLATVPRCDMDCSSLQQHSRLLVVIWSSSVNETQISTKRKFAADDACPLEVEQVPVKSLTEDGHTGVVVPATPIPQRSSSAPREPARYWVRRARSGSSRLLCTSNLDCQRTV